MADILSTLKSIILVFQSDYVSLAKTCWQLLMIIKSIISDFIRSKNSLPYYGVHLANYINEYNLSSNDLPSNLI